MDMDAFYAAVEALDEPALAGKPLIVGGTGRRGVVASASYEARAYGVRSAMPMTRAQRLCPHAIVVPGRHARYRELSARIHEIFEQFTPLVEGISLDEAFLDVAGAARLWGPPLDIAQQIRTRLADALSLSASVGVARTKFLAKLASEAAKPKATLRGVQPGRGVVEVPPERELSFLHPLPIEAMWGVGPATAERLRRLGVASVGQLAAVPLPTLIASVGRAAGTHLHDLAWGRDDRAVEPNQAAKSVSHEETYAVDRFDLDELHRRLVALSESVASRLREASLAGRTVTLKVRYGDFTTLTRSSTLARPADSGAAVVAVAAGLLAQVDCSAGVRLLGVGVTNLTPADTTATATQLALDLDEDVTGESPINPHWDAANRAVDAIRGRFGEYAVGPAALTGEDRGAEPASGRWGPDRT